MKKLPLVLMLLATGNALADDIVPPAAPFTGYHWYNEPKNVPATPKQPAPAPPGKDLASMSPTQQAKVLKELTQDALNKAILYPSSENTATFLRWQKFWTDRASMFSQSFAVAQLKHPDLDYNLEYSHYNSTAPMQQAKDQQDQEKGIAELAGKYGMFYFYRGKEPLDAQMAGIVADFARTHHISLIPVSVDGQVASTVPGSRPDNGQSKSLDIHYFPALFLVQPQTHVTQALAYGFMTQDDLAKRFLNVATGFKPNF